MTQPEIDALALRVGVTREKFPEFFVLSDCCTCGDKFYEYTCGNLVRTWICILPDPDSDDPTACLWEPFLMRALPNGFYLRQATWAGEVAPNEWVVLGPSWFYEDAQEVIGTGATPTAALYAAWLAKEKP